MALLVASDQSLMEACAVAVGEEAMRARADAAEAAGQLRVPLAEDLVPALDLCSGSASNGQTAPSSKVKSRNRSRFLEPRG